VAEIANILERNDWAAGSNNNILRGRLDSILLKLKLSAIEIGDENDHNARFNNGASDVTTRRHGVLLDVRSVLRRIEARPNKFVYLNIFYISFTSFASLLAQSDLTNVLFYPFKQR
jgi:hypothetical protein